MKTHIDLFAGIGGFSLAAKNLNVSTVAFSEIDKAAIEAYHLNFPTHINIGDITKLETIPAVDIVTAGVPCFTADHLVTTPNGYKKIQDIIVGDFVLTHKGRYRKVLNVGNTISNTWLVKGMGIPGSIETTEDHPFYVKEKTLKYINRQQGIKRSFSTPQWIETKNLTSKHYSSIVSSPTCKKNKTEIFWYMIGRYTGDGWYVSSKRKNRKNSTQNRFYICCRENEFDELNKKFLEFGYHYNFTKEKTIFKFRISQTDLVEFVKLIGKGASNKKIHPLLFTESNKNIKAFLNGLFDSDGHFDANQYVITSTSKELILGVQFLINKVYNATSNITYTIPEPTTIIQGRTVKQKPYYKIFWKTNKGKSALAFKEGKYTWFPLREIINCKTQKKVYNIEVEEDNSYTINNIVVHNCQAWSIAGDQKGFDDPRGKLWEDTIRVIKNSQPKAFICENVKGMTFKKHKKALEFIISQFEEAGYQCHLQVLNSKDFLVPQNRERLFIVGFQKSNAYANNNFSFPVGQKTKLVVGDILEKDVASDFKLSKKAMAYMDRKFGKRTRWDSYATHSNEISHCITANYHKGVPYNVLIDYRGKMFVRNFTPRELARLQGYPDEFQLHHTKTHAYKQLGNSITVHVVQAVMNNVLGVL